VIFSLSCSSLICHSSRSAARLETALSATGGGLAPSAARSGDDSPVRDTTADSARVLAPNGMILRNGMTVSRTFVEPNWCQGISATRPPDC
jgi:hypothetical protein